MVAGDLRATWISGLVRYTAPLLGGGARWDRFIAYSEREAKMAKETKSPKSGRLYLEEDADLELISDRQIAVLGYGSQGHAQAQNMRDSGLNVIIGNVEDNFAEQARGDGFEVVAIADAVKRSDITLMLIPDEVQADVYRAEIGPNLKESQVLVFASGYAVHFGLIRPPEFVDVVLAVPACVGGIVRERFANGQGVFGHFAVHQDHSGKARQIALAVARGIGLLRFGADETTFEGEVVVNLFAETAGLCGIIPYLLMAYEVLVEAGISPESAYSETFYELQFVAESLNRMTIGEAVAYGSPTATYLGLTRTPEVVTEDIRDRMRRMLRCVQSGELVRDWNLEQLAGRPLFNQLKREMAQHPISEVQKVFIERRKASGG